MREELICDPKDANDNEMKSILFFTNKFFNLNNDSHLKKNIINNINDIISVLRKRDLYESYLYLKLLQIYTSNEKIYGRLVNNSDFKIEFTTKISKMVSLEECVAFEKDLSFYSYLSYKYTITFFEVVNSLNTKINEHLQILETKDFSDFKSFLALLDTKLKNKFATKTESFITNIIAMHSIRSYSTLNPLKQLDRIDYQQYLKNLNYLPHCENYNNTEVMKINKMKFYVKDDKQVITSWYDNLNNINNNNLDNNNINKNEDQMYHELSSYLITLNKNIWRRDEDKEDKCLLDDLILISFQSVYLQAYILKESLFNYNCINAQDDGKKEMVATLNLLIRRGSKFENLSVVTILRLIDDYLFAERVKLTKMIEEILNKKEDQNKPLIIYLKNNEIAHQYFKNSLIKDLRDNEITDQDFKKTLMKYFGYNNNNNTDLILSLCKLKKGLKCWDLVLADLDFEDLVGKLKRIGANKTCLMLIQEIVHCRMRKEKLKSIIKYNNDSMIYSYKECLSSIDNNEYIMSKFCLNQALNDKIIKYKIQLNSGIEISEKDINNFKDKCNLFFVNINFENDLKFIQYEKKSVIKSTMETHYLKIVFDLINMFYWLTTSDPNFNKYLNTMRNSLLTILTKSFFKSPSKTYSNYSFHKTYYEIHIILESMAQYRKLNFNNPITEDTKTKKLIKEIFQLRVLGDSNSNLIQLKIRRVFCHLYKIYEMELDILSKILKILKNMGDKENVKLFFEQYLIIFQKYSEINNSNNNQSRQYEILKFYFYLNKIDEFETLFKTTQVYNTTIPPSYKFQILNLKMLGKGVFPIGRKFLFNIVDTRINTKDTSFFKRLNDGEHDIKEGNFYGFDTITGNMPSDSLNEYCLLINFKINLLEKIFSWEYEQKNGIIAEYLNNISYILYSLVFMCVSLTMSDNKKALFKILPKTINYLYKLYNLLDKLNTDPYNKDFKPFLQGLCKELKKLTNDKIIHIVPQLMMACNIVNSGNIQSPIYELAIHLLAQISNEYIYENANWIASMLLCCQKDSELHKKKEYSSDEEKDLFSNVYIRQKQFGELIYYELYEENKKIVRDYKDFQILLKDIPKLAIEHDKEQINSIKKAKKILLNEKIREINKVLAKGKFVSPKLKILRRDLNLLEKNANIQENHKQSKIKKECFNNSHLKGKFSDQSMHIELGSEFDNINEEDKGRPEVSKNKFSKNMTGSYKETGMIQEVDEDNYKSNKNFNLNNNFNNNFNINSNINKKSIPDFDDDMYIGGMLEEVTVMQSKGRPVKITFLSKAGKKHIFLLKSEDEDVFKELKAIEVFLTLNNILKCEELDKILFIGLRLYNMVPISQYCVIIEWVDDTDTYCSIIYNLLEMRGVEWRFPLKNHPKSGTQKFYRDKFWEAPHDVNVLYKHFLNLFPDPNLWYEAKMRYLISTAVWCMAGFLAGLGDRHKGNILLGGGEAIHIDFGFIMGVGKILPVSEVVDFRFTTNVRMNLGLLEEDGLFLFYCVEILKAFTKHFENIFPKLQSFTLDPLTTSRVLNNMTSHLLGVKQLFGEFEKNPRMILEKLQEMCNTYKSPHLLQLMWMCWAGWI